MNIRLHLLVLGGNVRRIRQRHKLSQEALAKKTGLHRTYICDVERGIRNVTIGTLIKIARATKTTAAKLATNV